MTQNHVSVEGTASSNLPIRIPMLTDKDYADPEQILEGKSETVQAQIEAVDVTGKEHSKKVTLVYDKEQVESADVLQDVNKEIEEEFKEKELTFLFDEKMFTDKIVRFKVTRGGEPWSDV